MRKKQKKKKKIQPISSQWDNLDMWTSRRELSMEKRIVIEKQNARNVLISLLYLCIC